MTSNGVPKPQYSIWQALSTAITLSMRAIEEIRALAREPGPQGEKGDPGRDGFSLADFTAHLEDEGRVIVLGFGSGATRKEFRLTTGSAIYRGVFTDGKTYERGDLATWGGSVWHCNAESAEKPGDGSKAWTLAVKKGRDGRDGKDGDKGERGLEGKAGRSSY